jgi:hypothetical protein
MWAVWDNGEMDPNGIPATAHIAAVKAFADFMRAAGREHDDIQARALAEGVKAAAPLIARDSEKRILRLEARLAQAKAALSRLALSDEIAGMGVYDQDPEVKARCSYAQDALDLIKAIP